MDTEGIMTVGKLREFLKNTKLPDETPIILSKTAESDSLSPCCDEFSETYGYIPETTWSGEMTDDLDEDEDAVQAVFLWPVN